MSDDPRTTVPGELAPPRPAASLVLLRDDPNGLQALLLERPSEDRVLAGARVFPGGKLDREDAEDALLARFDVPPHVLHARLGEPELGAHEAAALFVAAVREAFEETGVLLARGVDEALAARARALRRAGLGAAASTPGSSSRACPRDRSRRTIRARRSPPTGWGRARRSSATGRARSTWPRRRS